MKSLITSFSFASLMLVLVAGCGSSDPKVVLTEASSLKARSLIQKVEAKLPGTIPSEFDEIFQTFDLDAASIRTTATNFLKKFDDAQDTLQSHLQGACDARELDQLNAHLDAVNEGFDLAIAMIEEIAGALESSGAKRELVAAFTQGVQYAKTHGLDVEIKQTIKDALNTPEKAQKLARTFIEKTMKKHGTEIKKIAYSVDMRTLSRLKDAVTPVLNKYQSKLNKLVEASAEKAKGQTFSPKCQESLEFSAKTLLSRLQNSLN